MEIIGHRGASADAPENTLAAFRLAFEQGADAAELDLHFTKDRRIAVIHDASAKRTTSLDRLVKDLTADELRVLDAGSWKGEWWRGERVPLLEEALATIPDGRRLFLEIKCGSEVLPELAKVVAASKCRPAQLPLIGFDDETMRAAKIALPDHPVCLIASHRRGQSPEIEKLIERARAANLDGLDLDYRFPIDAALVAKVHRAGLQCYVWTVDQLAIARRLAAAGIDGLTTNRPGALRSKLR